MINIMSLFTVISNSDHLITIETYETQYDSKITSLECDFVSKSSYFC